MIFKLVQFAAHHGGPIIKLIQFLPHYPVSGLGPLLLQCGPRLEVVALGWGDGTGHGVMPAGVGWPWAPWGGPGLLGAIMPYGSHAIWAWHSIPGPGMHRRPMYIGRLCMPAPGMECQAHMAWLPYGTMAPAAQGYPRGPRATPHQQA